MFFLQRWQVSLFLRAHGARSDWLYPALFNARKGILNTVLPARSGTLLLLHSLARHYAIKWHHNLYFSLLASAVSLYVSVLALVWILWPLSYSFALLLTSLGLSEESSRSVGKCGSTVDYQHLAPEANLSKIP